MSRKHRSRHRKRRGPRAMTLQRGIQGFHQKNLPTDARLLLAGGVLLVVGVVVMYLKPLVSWSGWMQDVVQDAVAALLVSGMTLIFITVVGRSQPR